MTLGELIKDYRKKHSLSQQSFANITGLSKAYISILERNFNPVNGKQPVPSVATIKTVAAAMHKDFNDIISILDPDTQITINSENSSSKSVTSSTVSKLSPKEERDIARQLEKTLNQLSDENGALMFDGEPLDDETRELLRASLENQFRIARVLAKEKFTPKKYRKPPHDDD